jgi:hypothetical protein
MFNYVIKNNAVIIVGFSSREVWTQSHLLGP